MRAFTGAYLDDLVEAGRNALTMYDACCNDYVRLDSQQTL